MDKRIKRIYMPMTESGFYILLSLQQEAHGYQISQSVLELTGGQVTISPGTMYGTLSKMEKDGLIVFKREEDKRKLYQIASLGKEVLECELARIERLYHNSRGKKYEKNDEI
ncbi:PadR family transcriptional regulator [Streptococcus cameli]